MSDLYLTDDEVIHITGKRYRSAQRKALLKMGYEVKHRPDGTFWVPRGQFSSPASQQAIEPRTYKVNLGALTNACA